MGKWYDVYDNGDLVFIVEVYKGKNYMIEKSRLFDFLTVLRNGKKPEDYFDYTNSPQVNFLKYVGNITREYKLGENTYLSTLEDIDRDDLKPVYLVRWLEPADWLPV